MPTERMSALKLVILASGFRTWMELTKVPLPAVRQTIPWTARDSSALRAVIRLTW